MSTRETPPFDVGCSMFGVRCSLLSLLLPCLLSASAADAPYWWIARSVLDTNAVANDYAAVNQGQAKWMAVQAAAELDRLLPGGAGLAISNLTAGFGSGGNELPLNLGQLKFLAAPFYDRIRAGGFTNALPEEMPGFYPWTENSSDDNDFGLANIGQLKRVFSFDLEMCFDTDGDGIPDGMEGRWGLNKYNPADASLPSTNPWAHGLTNLQVFQNPSVLRADNFSSAYDDIPDWWKVMYEYDVNDVFVDTSNDDDDMWCGLEEFRRGSSPRHFDTLTLRFERREMTATKGGFEEFQPSAPPKVKMYLWQEELWSDWILAPFAGCDPIGAGGVTSHYDVATGSYSSVFPSGVGMSLGTPPATSSTSRSGMVTGTEECAGCQWVGGGGWYTNEETQEVTWEGGGDWGCPGHDGTQQVQINLFDEFTTPMLLGRLVETMPPFLDEFDQVWVDQGVFGFETDPLQPTPAAWFDVSSNELTAVAGKIQYKFWLDSAPQNRFVSWMEIFTPEDDPATPQDESATPEYTLRHWPDETHPDAGQDETPVYTIDPLAATEPRQGTNRIVVLPRAQLVADWDHDRVIADDDDLALPRNPFRFWINDDTDVDDVAVGRGDEPGGRLWLHDDEGAPYVQPLNCADETVNGRADLADFFPAWIGLTNLLAKFPSGGTISCRLRQADSAVRVIFTDLTRTNAGTFLATDGTAYGPGLNQHSYEATSVLVTAEGVDVPLGFLARLVSDPERGVLLIEGVAKSTQPLVLEVRYDDTPVGVATLPLSIDTISKMYGWINLRAVTGGGVKDKTKVDEAPTNYPRELCNRKHVVFVHGYNVDEDGARASASEVFKRLYQSGSRAMFTAVTWYGDEVGGVLPAPLYLHLDVANAFGTASSLSSCVRQLPGEVHIMTHSLGAMVVASAIHDYGLAPTRLYMLDAAIATEAFDPSVQHVDEMTPPDWAGYTNRLLASQWYALFPSDDGRHGLTWCNRIGDIPQAINYFSSGEEVLKNNETPGWVYLPNLSELFENFMEGVWVYQERMKGCWEPAFLWGPTSQGGWGFNDGMSGYGHWVRVGGSSLWGSYNSWERLSVQEANEIPPEQLRRKSFFKPFERGDLYDPVNGSETAAEPMVRAKVLAEAIPALSWATGANPIVNCFGNHNEDMMFLKNGWPESRMASHLKGRKWLHGDFRDVGYFFVCPLYDNICSRGGLR